MRRRISSIALFALLSIALMGLSVLLTGSIAEAGAPPRTSSGQNASTFQQSNSAPSQPDGGWAIIAQFPNTRVHLPETQAAITQTARIKRAGAVAFPPNGKIYLLGGRMGIDGEDNPTSNNGNRNFNFDNQNPIGPSMPPYTWLFEYSPGNPGSWARKQADIDPCPPNIPTNKSVQCPGERYTSNMAVATLTNGQGTFIYAIGGSNINSVPTTTVRIYNPIADSVSYLTTDPWPASPARVPGGYAVLDNKLYIFGGFDPRGNGTMYGDTWVFDPMAAAGSRWSHPPTANLSTPRAYIAGVALDGYIYAIGGDTWVTNTVIAQRKLLSSNVVERLDPGVGTWLPVASLPTPKGDAGAWAYDSGTGFDISGKLVVAGGHSDTNNYLLPNTSAYIFEPPSGPDPDGSWSAFTGLANATRNFGAVAHNGFLYAIGGYDYSGGYPDSAGFTQRYDAGGTFPTSTSTPTPSTTATTTPSRTATPACTCIPTATHTIEANTSTSTSTSTLTATSTATSTGTAMGTATGTALPTSTETWTATRTATRTATMTGPPSATPTCVCASTPTPTACTVQFEDVAANSTFYPFVRCLACRGIVGGYPCGSPDEPCGPGADAYYRPGSNITRGQIAKIVSESAGLHDDQDEQFYEDVPPGSPFYVWINRLSWRGYMGGYACNNDPAQPCGPGNLPYFRPNANATRGQLSKIVANAALIDDPVSGQTYQDVPPSDSSESFYIYIERLTARNVMGGYACGTPNPNSGPCDDQDRPYFRPNNPVTRGQAAKIVANTFFPNCQTP